MQPLQHLVRLYAAACESSFSCLTRAFSPFRRTPCVMFGKVIWFYWQQQSIEPETLIWTSSSNSSNSGQDGGLYA
jgi:hypothetical protein